MDRRSIIIIGVTVAAVFIVLAIIIGTGMLNNEPAVGPRDSVEIRNMEFSPSAISVPVGTTITWFNNDTVDHTVTSNDGRFANSSNLANGGSYAVTFTEAGEFSYHCSLHPSMNGKVVVR